MSLIKLKKRRTPVRKNFTKTANELKTLVENENPDMDSITMKYKRLEKLQEELMELNKQISDNMLEECTDEDFQNEYDSTEEYEIEWIALTIIMEKFTTGVREELRSVSEADNYQRNSRTSIESNRYEVKFEESKRGYKLPKIEIQKFDGKLTGWLPFWSQYRKIHEDENIHDADKFQYLSQYMSVGTRAKKLVDSYPQTAENYNKVIEALHDRFGDKVLLTEVYVRKLLTLVIANVSQPGKTKLSEMYDDLESHLRALETLGVTTEQSAAFLYPMVESSLPEEVIRVWQRCPSAGYGEDAEEKKKSVDQRLCSLMSFLKQEIKGIERLAYVKAGFENSINSKKLPSDQPKLGRRLEATAAGLFTGNKKMNCVFCDKFHQSQNCFKAQEMTVEDIRKKLSDHGLCFNCFRHGHKAKACRTKLKCLICKRNHYPIMCEQIPNRGIMTNKSEENVTANNANHVCSSSVLLKTQLVRIIGAKGSKVVRLIYDEGSQLSYIKRSAAKELGCEEVAEEWLQQSLFGGSLTAGKKHKKYKVLIESLNGIHRTSLMLLDQEDICGKLPRNPKGPWIEELKQQEIIIQDIPEYNTDIVVLVGSDYWGECMTGNLYQTTSGLTAVETIFGWTLCGRIPNNLTRNASLLVTAMFSKGSVSNFWDLEVIGIRDPIDKLTEDQHNKVMWEHFKKTVTQGDNGRYVVCLPWHNDRKEIPNNFPVAKKRLVTMSVKMKVQGNYQSYNEVLLDWEKENMIEECKLEPEGKNCHYLPHRAVYKYDSRTTPIRPVFDASCKIGKNPSLNDCLQKGINLLELIPNLLIRFREKNIGVSADIRKAFMMIEVHPKDRDALRFLWWKDDSMKEIKVYRHTRVVFGVTCSPFLLEAVIKYHLEKITDHRKGIAEQLITSFYVDNVITSVNNVTEYEYFKETATEILAEAKMDLRLWERSFLIDDVENKITNILGLLWDKETDMLSVKIPDKVQSNKMSKRELMSLILKIYDPMGYLSPVLLTAKLLMRKVWVSNQAWDELLNDEIENEFSTWWEQLQILKEMWIPRSLSINTSSCKDIQLHVFCDASKDAYFI